MASNGRLCLPPIYLMGKMGFFPFSDGFRLPSHPPLHLMQSELCRKFTPQQKEQTAAHTRTFPCNRYFHVSISATSLSPSSRQRSNQQQPHVLPPLIELAHAGPSGRPSDGFVCLRDLTLSSLIFNADHFSARNGGLQQTLIPKEGSLPWLPIIKLRPLQALSGSTFTLVLSWFSCY